MPSRRYVRRRGDGTRVSGRVTAHSSHQPERLRRARVRHSKQKSSTDTNRTARASSKHNNASKQIKRKQRSNLKPQSNQHSIRIASHVLAPGWYGTQSTHTDTKRTTRRQTNCTQLQPPRNKERRERRKVSLQRRRWGTPEGGGGRFVPVHTRAHRGAHTRWKAYRRTAPT